MTPCKILIIDDDEDDVEILTKAFTDTGVIDICHVHSANQAFNYLADVAFEFLPKLIITDMHLAGVTGKEFLFNIKGLEKYKHIQVVIFSSAMSDQEFEKCRKLGALDYLIKPSTFGEYIRVATDIIGRIELN
ncbi:response regulator [Segetibacter sp. 3557_3]|uniref:response regulator n=1 Tax=Segetibacter sp. 3557_3 TaxID=2547429 RepID=UPI0010588618|nr:response regulator [Segetibacter sp. 3557_3]TDH28899.1 response regulator [Segetibacter sp. 3557_3]